MGVKAEAVSDLRYRGNGWPGDFAPTRRGEKHPYAQMSYEESWAFLQAHRPWSVQLWPDGAGELADISCGDPWYERPDGKNPGSSLVVARTARGREIVRGAMEAGYLTLQPAEGWKLDRSQPNLLKKKGAVWGRVLALRMVGLPTPDFRGLRLFGCWLKLPLNEKLRSTLGTIRRIVTRKLIQPLPLDRSHSVPVKPAMRAGGAAPTGSRQLAGSPGCKV
jgi:coenzyme F420 hydrogenase subunit beta